tara:strand:+ start:108 stop:635 length:528 start_codon:yes stop_codon:yes gene_type:complete
MYNQYDPNKDLEEKMRQMLASQNVLSPEQMSGMSSPLTGGIDNIGATMTQDPRISQISADGGIDNTQAVMNEIANGPIVPEVAAGADNSFDFAAAMKGLAGYENVPINAPPMGPVQRGGGLMPLNAPPMAPYGASSFGLLNSLKASPKSKKDKEKDEADGSNIDKFSSIKAFLGV